MRSRASGAARLDASSCCFCERALVPRRVAGSLNGTSDSRLASDSASPIVLVVVLVLDLFARIEAAHSNADTREDFLTGSNTRALTKGRGRERLGKRRKKAGKPLCESSGGAPSAAIRASDLVHRYLLLF
jgi:hypothetical protein